VDWVVRSDILGDGQLMKTYTTVAKGYDRCGDHDEVIFDYTISKLNKKAEETVIDEGRDQRYSMIDWNSSKSSQNLSKELTDKMGFPVKEHLNPSLDLINDGKFTFSMRKVLKSMKLGEKSFTIIQPEWLKKNDHEAIQRYELEEGDRLKLDLYFKNMLHIEDFFRDGTCYK
jgi:hypothetical protein